MNITERLEKIGKVMEDTKAENSRLEGSIEPITKDLIELCGTTDNAEIETIIATKKAEIEKDTLAIEAEVKALETKLGIA